MFEYNKTDLNRIAQSMLTYAGELGASSVAVQLSEAFGLSVSVRCLQLETIEQHRGKSFSITIYQDKRRGQASSTDFSEQALRETVKAAFEISRFTAEDSCSGLPEVHELGNDRVDPGIFFEWPISVADAVELAQQTEQAAFDKDPSIANSDGSSVSTLHSHFLLANSLGFSGGYKSSRHTISCSPIAKRGDQMQRDGWYSSNCNSSLLSNPQELGSYAAQRSLDRLGSKRLGTGKMPVLFEAPLACGLLGHFVQAISGGSLYRRESFLLESLDKKIFPSMINIIEDPFLAGALGSTPFDGEGVQTHKRLVVENGRVKGYFLSTYSARKLSMTSTGNAGGSHNLFLTSQETQATDTLTEMLKKLDKGLFVTDLMGFGVNYVTGDYSRGASGFWVENGEIQYPVEEITIAGNLKDMFQGITAIGSDVIVRGSKRSGSVLINQMSIAGD